MQLEELKRKTCQGQWIIPGGEGGVIKDPLERKTLGGEGGVQIKEFSIGGGYGYFLEPHIAAQYEEHGSVEWWL